MITAPFHPARGFWFALGFVTIAATSFAASPAKFTIEEATIAAIQQAIVAKQTTSTEVVKLYLARIKAYNGPAVDEPYGLLGPVKIKAHAKGINALSTLNLRPATRKAWGFDDRKARSMTDLADADPNMPDALEVAAKQDEHFARTGKLVGPLHGVVMAFKDQYDTFDLRTTSGADAFYANDRPPQDATFVARLRSAGAIILAKANLSEYANGIPRSSFGGTFANPYDTERNPGISSSGSGSSVAANFVTCAIAEETGSSIRGPAYMNNSVGISPTQELVSRHGMIQMGINTRVGPIARTVEDAARILSVIAGYDAKDPLTAFSVGRLPDQPYEMFAREKTLKGIRIGVVREYMDKKLFTQADTENIDLVSKAVEELKKLGATIIDPGEGGELLTEHVRKLHPMLMNAGYTKQYPEAFPVDADGKPKGDHLATLVDYAVDPSKAVGKLTLRDIGGNPAATNPAAGAPPPPLANNGEGRFTLNVYLRERGRRQHQEHHRSLHTGQLLCGSELRQPTDDLGKYRQSHGARHGGAHATALRCPTNPHAGVRRASAGCSGVSHQQHPAQQARLSVRTPGQRPDRRVVISGAAGLPRNHCPRGLYHPGL